MADMANVLDRIDAEFAMFEGNIARARGERLQEHRERRKSILSACGKTKAATASVAEPDFHRGREAACHSSRRRTYELSDCHPS